MKTSKQRYETYKVGVLSTGHITVEDNDRLREEAVFHTSGGPIVYDLTYGYLIYIPADKVSLAELLEELTGEEHGYSQTLANLIRMAHEQGWRYLHLDSDGPECEWLPVFEW